MAPRQLATVPASHHRARDTMQKRWKHLDGQAPVFAVELDGRAALVAMTADQFLIAVPGMSGNSSASHYSEVKRTQALDRRLTVTMGFNYTVSIVCEASDDAAYLAAELERARQMAAPGDPAYLPPRPATESVLIVTTNDVPGYEIVAIHGDVFGLIVRARNMFANFGANLRTVVGGEVGGFTKLLVESRNEARERLAREALNRGANAVVAMRFDCNEIADVMSEVAAYGTAVTIQPLRPEPTPGAGPRA
jgi:uncharacterized protein YbjQ (UPF0145 family)